MIFLKHLDGRLTNVPSVRERKKNVNRPTNRYAMGTNLSGWGYPPSQALSFSSRLPGIAVDVNSTPKSVPGVYARTRDLPIFSSVLPFEDNDDPGTDSSKIGLGEYTGGLSVIVERVEIRL